VVLAGHHREDDAAVLDLDGLHAEQDAEGWRRKLAGHHRAQGAQAVELGDLRRRRDGVVVDDAHAAWRSGVGSGLGFSGRGGSWAGVIAASHGYRESMVTIGPGKS
jgi:hypothetical protein